MADRNEVFRIILEGRDRLSKELDSVRAASDKLDESLKRLKRNKPDEFPLFGGGKATRGPGGQFIQKEDITRVDQMRQQIDRLNTSIGILKRNKPSEFPLFGGGRAVRGDDGRFIRVQDVTLLEKAKNRIDAIDKSLARIKSRARRGPLGEDEIPGAGGTRLTRNQVGQFVRAQDITLLQRFGRELAVVRGGIRDIQRDVKQGFLLDAEKMFDAASRGASRLDAALGRLITKLRRGTLPGFGGTTVRRGPGGQFVRVEDISLIDKATQGIGRLQAAITRLRRGRLKEGEAFGFGGTRLTRNEQGQFVKVEDISLMQRGKNLLNDIDSAVARIKSRVKRGPLLEGEIAGAGGTRLTRGDKGQFVKAEDLTIVQRIGREFTSLSSRLRTLQNQSRQGILLGVSGTVDDLRRVRTSLDDLAQRARKALLGGTTIKTGPTGLPTLVSVKDITTLGRLVNAVERGFARIKTANEKAAASQRATVNEVAKSFKVGFGSAQRTQEIIDERVAGSRELIKQRKIDLQKQQEEDRVNLSAREDRVRRRVKEALEEQREVGEVKIEQLRRDLKTLADTEENEDERAAIKAEIRQIRRERRLKESRVSADLSARFQRERAGQRIEFSGQRRAITSPDIDAIEKQALDERSQAINKIESALGRMGFRAGQAFGDITRGAKSARSGVKDMDRDLRLVNNTFTRFGFAIGTIFKNFGQLVNLRWLFLTGILSTFFTLIVQLGTALVALAASAIQAGAALGGAFLSGLAQALPVVGLLAAAFHEFNKVLDAVKLNEKLGAKAKDSVDDIRQAAQRLADAQYSLKKAIEGVGDAQLSVVDANKDLKKSYKEVRDATKDLADAKVQAARDIVDANLEEKDAALSLKEAELGVLEAKQKLREEENKKKAGGQDANDARAALKEAQERLRIATAQKDDSEISGAQQAVTIAEQNLNAILDQVDNSKTDLEDAQLGVKRANLTLEQARVRNTRAAKDAKDARDKGVAGSDVVKSANEQLKNALDGVEKAQRSVVLANRGVRDALHQVAVAQREVADARRAETEAHNKQSQADKDAQKAFADLSPAEKKLFNSLKRLRKVFKDVFVGNSERDGILGPITEAIARFADTLTKLLLDPKIQKAAANLAQAIADALDKFREFVGSSEFKEALLFFTEKAADNIPRVVDGMLNLAKAFLNIAQAANPIFDRLLKGAVGLTGRFKNATSQSGETRRPEEGAAGHGRGSAVATINQSGLDKFLEGASKHLDDWLKLSAAIIGLIDAIANSAAADTGRSFIQDLTTQLNKFADFIRDNPEKVRKFFDDARDSIENLSKVLGRLTTALVKSFSSSEFTAFASTIADVVIPGLLLFIFTLGKLSKFLQFVLNIPVVGDIVKWALAILVAEKAFNKVFPVTQKLTNGVKELGKAVFRAGRLLLAPGGFKAALEAVEFQAKKAGGQVKKLGESLLDIGKRGAQNAGKAIKAVETGFYKAGKAAADFAVAVGRAVYAALASMAKLIVGQVLIALRSLTLGIRLLVSATIIGALITAAILIITHWDKVKKFAKILADFLLKEFKKVTDWVKDNWKKILIGALIAPFLLGALPFIAIYKFRKQIVDILQGAAKLIIKAFQSIIDWARTHWRLLATIIISIFIPGAGLIIAVFKFRDRILGVFTAIKDGIIGAFKSAFTFVKDEFGKVIEFLSKQYDKLPGPVKALLKATAKVAGVAGAAAGKAKDIGDAILRRASGGTVPGKGKGDTVPALLTPGEWVLNDAQQSKLSKLMGTSKKAIVDFLFTQTGQFTAGRPKGLLTGGNIDIMHRPQVKNKDGSTSSVASGTFSTPAGTYVLPTVIGNKVVSPNAAFAHFTRTGENLGLFDSVAHAEAYSQKLHMQQAALGQRVAKLDTVKRNLKPGQWVLNQSQQIRAAHSIGASVQQLRAQLFGTNSTTDPRTGKREAGFNTKLRTYRDFNLISQVDPNGVSVWFIELANKSFGQVTARDAKRIQDSDGRYIPGYVKRSAAGFKGGLHTVVDGPRPGLALRHWIKRTPTRAATEAFIRNSGQGGFTAHKPKWAHGVQRFAEGGVVQAPGDGGVSRGGDQKTINQSFNVQTQGETDWGYVMRIGAVHAQESF